MSQIGCWLCGGRGERQIVLRPGGIPDGRRICRVCARRLFAWLHEEALAGRAEGFAALWPPVPRSEEPGADEASRVFCESVRAALAAEDDLGRALVGTGYLEMRMFPEALEALSAVNPEALEAGVFSDRLLTSLLSRLLDGSALGEGARERIQTSLYPGA